MSWEPKEKEIAALQATEASARYIYFIKKIVDNETIWGLYLNGWAVMADNNGKECIPVWPHAKFAMQSATGHWLNYLPKEIKLDDWLNRWIPGMKNDGRNVAVFPNLNDQGSTVSSDQILSDINSELSNYD